MKYPYPPKATQREIVSRLKTFFKTEEIEFFNAAMNMFFSYYEEPQPTVEWYVKLDDPKVAGLTYSNGRIELYTPSSWKQNRKYRTRKQWLVVVLHELWHYLVWIDEERKADEFANGFLKV